MGEGDNGGDPACPNIAQEGVGAGGDIGDHLAAGTAVPDGPTGSTLADLRGREPFVLAVVELAEAIVDREQVGAHDDLGGDARSLHRTRVGGATTHVAEHRHDALANLDRLGATGVAEGQIGGSGVPAGHAPFGGPVSDQHQLHALNVVACVKSFGVGVEVEAVVRQVPAWATAPLEIRPLLGGITNRNFVVAVDGTQYVVRIPGERTSLLGIDRRCEAEASQRAADLGIGPPVLGELPGVGTQITQLVRGVHLDDTAFIKRLDEVVPLLRRFHESGPLGGSFPIHRVVEWHARDASSHGAIPPPAYERLHQHSRHIEAAFAESPLPPVPCHNDLLPANVLFAEDRAWLLDYEYAGMNDVFFDLANLSVNCGLALLDDQRLLATYFGAVTRTGWARLQLMKVMSEFREGMWAVVQQAISTLDTDFVSYANERLANCERLAAQPEFDQWLTDARRNPLP